MHKTQTIYNTAGIIIQNGKLLFTRASDTEFFLPPGGKIEKGETGKQALVRELKEELSVDVNESDLEFFGEFIADSVKNQGKTTNMQVYVVKKWQGVIAPDSEIEELRWLSSSLPTDIQLGSIFGGKVLPKLHEQGLVD